MLALFQVIKRRFVADEITATERLTKDNFDDLICRKYLYNETHIEFKT